MAWLFIVDKDSNQIRVGKRGKLGRTLQRFDGLRTVPTRQANAHPRQVFPGSIIYVVSSLSAKDDSLRVLDVRSKRRPNSQKLTLNDGPIRHQSSVSVL